jgi:predicted alpha/beta hydrolase
MSQSFEISPPDDPTQTLFIKTFGEKSAPRGAALFIHGAIENGKIFYSNTGRGIAPFFAEQGFHSFVPDLRGKGRSKPHVSKKSKFSQTDQIVYDMPLLMSEIEKHGPNIPITLVAHSWGGVFIFSFLARNPQFISKVKAIILFGTKRSVRVWNWERIFKIDIVWTFFGTLLVYLYGFLTFKRFGIGSDNESKATYIQQRDWVKPSKWIDREDGFNYSKALKKIKLPPVLAIMGKKDLSLGHPSDCKRFLKEAHVADLATVWELEDEDHFSFLIQPRARKELFPRILEWMKLE